MAESIPLAVQKKKKNTFLESCSTSRRTQQGYSDRQKLKQDLQNKHKSLLLSQLVSK